MQLSGGGLGLGLQGRREKPGELVLSLLERSETGAKREGRPCSSWPHLLLKTPAGKTEGCKS